jgi:hypothetical protein
MERDFIKTAEVIGNIAQKVYGVGRFVTQRLFVPGGWVGVAPEETPANIQVHEANLIKGEE